eukprot:351328-Chlamydomonas_euryale.AAC.2
MPKIPSPRCPHPTPFARAAPPPAPPARHALPAALSTRATGLLRTTLSRCSTLTSSLFSRLPFHSPSASDPGLCALPWLPPPGLAGPLRAGNSVSTRRGARRIESCSEGGSAGGTHTVSASRSARSCSCRYRSPRPCSAGSAAADAPEGDAGAVIGTEQPTPRVSTASAAPPAADGACGFGDSGAAGAAPAAVAAVGPATHGQCVCGGPTRFHEHEPGRSVAQALCRLAACCWESGRLAGEAGGPSIGCPMPFKSAARVSGGRYGSEVGGGPRQPAMCPGQECGNQGCALARDAAPLWQPQMCPGRK